MSRRRSRGKGMGMGMGIEVDTYVQLTTGADGSINFRLVAAQCQDVSL